MFDNIVALYCITDDLLKAIGHTDDRRRELTDAEVITTALASALYFGGNLQHARSFMKQSGFMPRMLSKSRLCRRLHKLELPAGSEVFMDSGYTDYFAEDAAGEADELRFSVCRKKNSKRRDEPAESYYKTLMRKRIETVFSEITRLFPKRIHAVTLKGLLMKVSFFIIAFTLDRAFV
jgi:hypothetical protein